MKDEFLKSNICRCPSRSTSSSGLPLTAPPIPQVWGEKGSNPVPGVENTRLAKTSVLRARYILRTRFILHPSAFILIILLCGCYGPDYMWNGGHLRPLKPSPIFVDRNSAR